MEATDGYTLCVVDGARVLNVLGLNDGVSEGSAEGVMLGEREGLKEGSSDSTDV